jgi:GTP cyclohydrolase II
VGVLQTFGFERDISNGSRRVETARAIVLGDLTEGAPLLRIQSRCFTGEVRRSRIETRMNNARRKYD